MNTLRRWSLTLGAAIVVATGCAMPAQANPPPDGPNSPFPDMAFVDSYYTELNPADFFVPGVYGVRFLTPSGLNCGIWDRGGFGCTGRYPGAPPGDNHIAWFNGNRAVHHGWTAAIQYPPGQGQRPLPPMSYINFDASTCGVTAQGDTFCEHGEFKFIMTAQGTWFKAWDDRRSYACLSYGSC